MAWMIVTKDINYRRPKGAFFHVKPSPEPQSRRWGAGDIVLPFGDISAIEVKYIDTAGHEQDLPAEQFAITESDMSAILRFRRNFTRPPLGDQPDAVKIIFTAGYGETAANVPTALKLAITLLACHWYENREATASQMVHHVPFSVDALITPHRRIFF